MTLLGRPYFAYSHRYPLGLPLLSAKVTNILRIFRQFLKPRCIALVFAFLLPCSGLPFCRSSNDQYLISHSSFLYLLLFCFQLYFWTLPSVTGKVPASIHLIMLFNWMPDALVTRYTSTFHLKYGMPRAFLSESILLHTGFESFLVRAVCLLVPHSSLTTVPQHTTSDRLLLLFVEPWPQLTKF